MNYCSHCGERNKQSSKFCIRCGTLLVALTSVRCTICGVANDSEHARCANCGAQLTPHVTNAPEINIPASQSTPEDKPLPSERRTAKSKRVTAVSEPKDLTKETAPPAKPESAPIPQWFMGVRPLTTAPAPAQTEPTPKTSSESQTVPDWLDELEKMPLPSQEPSVPLAKETPPDVATSSLETAPQALPPLPDWLRELQSGNLDEWEISQTKSTSSRAKRSR